MSSSTEKATVIAPPEPEPEEVAGPIVGGDKVNVEGDDSPQVVRFRRDLGRLVLQDGREVREADVTRA